MKKILSFLMTAILLSLLLTSCTGDKSVVNITVTSGLKTEYELNEAPDFSSVRANVLYNDGEVAEVDGSQLLFSKIDTSLIGEQRLNISYEGFTLTVNVTVKGSTLDQVPDEDGYVITAVSLPDSLALWENNKKDFVNKKYGYVVGDDNEFFFTLKLSVYSKDGEKLNFSSYTSASKVYFAGDESPLEGDGLKKYVEIDEERNSFDFTEEAIGKTFTIVTRPRDGVEGNEEAMSAKLTVKIVDGYNIYQAYELNYITNISDGFDFDDVDPNETRKQLEIVKDFLANEKNATHPGTLSSVVLHNNLTIQTTDLPKEYFYQKDRNNGFYDFLGIFDNQTSNENKSFTIYGNYFAIYSHNLPCVVESGVGNQDNEVSSSILFRFTCLEAEERDFDHTAYSTTLRDIMLVDDAPQSDNEANSKKAMLGICALKTYSQTINIENVKIQSYYVSLISEYDYQTVNINESVFYNSWQNHIHVIAGNNIQELDEEPLPKDEYPRLKLNITKSSITGSGGPAIIMQSYDATANANKHSGPEVKISADTTLESWVTGEEAWFKALQLTYFATLIKGYETNVNSVNSSFIREETKLVNGVPKKFKMVNIVAVNLIVPDLTLGVEAIFSQLQGKFDIDGKLTIGYEAVIDMDDYVYGDKTSNYANVIISDEKAKDSGNHAFTNTSGGLAIAGAGKPFKVVEGDLGAKSNDDYLTIYFYTLGIVLGNYHPI